MSELSAREDTSGPPPAFAHDLSGEVLAGLFEGAPEGGAPRELAGRYDFVRVAGEGGQGLVAIYRDRALGREVAIKITRSGRPRDEARLVREAALAARLDHPNIPTVYDLIEDDAGAPVLVMRRVGERSLAEEIRACATDARAARAFSLAQRLAVFLKICEAVEYAHAHGTLHLDLKPENVRLGEFGEVFVVDWGLATEKDAAETPSGGSLFYAAPEQLSGRGVDERTDVYALGVLLYHLATLELPFDAGFEGLRDYRERLGGLLPVRPRARAPSVGRDLEAVILKAMAREPVVRYGSADALAREVGRVLEGRPVHARRPGPLGRAARWARRNPGTTALAATLALVVALVATGAAAFSARERTRQAALRCRVRATVPYGKARALLERRGAAGADVRVEALRLLDKAIRLDPTYAAAYYERGRLHRDPIAAIEDFRAAYVRDEALLMAHYRAGLLFRDALGDTESARAEFDEMQKLDARNEYALLGKASLANIERDYRGALALADRIGANARVLPEVEYVRAFALAAKDNPERDVRRAAEHYTAYLAHAPGKASAYANRAVLLVELDRYDEALDDLDRALAIDPDYVWGLSDRGWLRYVARGDETGALADLDRAIALKPDHAFAYANRAVVREGTGRFDEALADLAEARRLDPTSYIFCARRAGVYFSMRRFGDAERAYGEALERAPSNKRFRVLHERGAMYLAAGRPEKAERDLAAALATRARGHLYTALLLYCARARLDDPGAEAALERSAAAPGAIAHLAAAARAILGRITEEEALAAAGEDAGRRCEVSYYLGARRLARGDLDRARELFEMCRATGYRRHFEYKLAGIELARLAGKDEQEKEDAKP